MAACYTCELIARRDRGEAPVWDSILRTEGWDVVHSFDTSLPGWLVLISRRHVASVAELSVEEAAEAGRLQRDVSIALAEAVGCSKTYVARFAEAAEHPHVHYHIIPRMLDLVDDAVGPRVFFRYLGAPESDWVPESRRNEIAEALRASLRMIRG